MTIEEDNTKVKLDEDSVNFGAVPIMVRSAHCNLNGLTNDELVAKGEDPIDPGGYFIVNGSERVVVPSEDLVQNRIITDTEYDPNQGKQVPVVKTYSQHQGSRSIVTIQRQQQDGFLEVSIPEAPEGLRFATISRVLGLGTDESIVRQFRDDPDVALRVLDLLEKSEAETMAEAWKVIGNEVRPGKPGFIQRDEISQLFRRNLLPHLNDISEKDDKVRLAKGRHLCRMAADHLKLELGKREPDDKDHYAYKRVQTVGALFARLFRTAVRRLARDIDYQVWMTVDRNRNPTVDSVVKSEVLTNRLFQSLSTGNWPGGRSGVSQLLDRRNHTATISHLRRLESPLSRSPPHFEARDLHATHWGRVCPSETPEGPNCGLTKNFARAVELSVEVPKEEELVERLASLGLQQ